MVETFTAPPPPFVAPPEMALESWQLPDYGRKEPHFPFLPGEDERISRSVGDVTTGYLVNGVALPIPHPGFTILERQYQRRFLYTSEPMVALLEEAMEFVHQEYPQAVLGLGNFSRKGGGNIPQSVSHNNGRDGDIAFFVVDGDDNPSMKPDLLRFDHLGWFRGPEQGEETLFFDLELRFDAPRNWRFVEGLIRSNAADIQYIFISTPLRNKLLQEARRQGVPAGIIRQANQLLVQPAGALPHDDHFHIRIHCTPEDLAAGCVERGRPGPTFHNNYRLQQDSLRKAQALLGDDDPDLRVRAIRRLSILGSHHASGELLRLIEDPHPAVRIAAIRALPRNPRSRDALIARLPEENEGHVFAELVVTLASYGNQAATPLIEALSRPLDIDLGPGGPLSATALVADALALLEDQRPVPVLLTALGEVPPTSRPQLLHALRVLTNHSFGARDSLVRDENSFQEVYDQWLSWWEVHQDLSREEWITLGFQRAGFSIEGLNEKYIWEICRAIMDEPHLNINAQRVLMGISGRNPDSLRWHPHDASFYWRRYFEQRQPELGLPPIPEDLTTAGGYTPPPE